MSKLYKKAEKTVSLIYYGGYFHIFLFLWTAFIAIMGYLAEALITLAFFGVSCVMEILIFYLRANIVERKENYRSNKEEIKFLISVYRNQVNILKNTPVNSPEFNQRILEIKVIKEQIESLEMEEDYED